MDIRVCARTLCGTIVLLIACACGEIDPGIWLRSGGGGESDLNASFHQQAAKLTPERLPLVGRLPALHRASDSSDLPSTSDGNNKNVSIAIIGAGFAGLAAFERIRSTGFGRVELFEASSRIGGRVYPIPFEDGYIQHGAQFINGKSNPIFEIAQRLGVLTSEIDDDELFWDADYRTGKCSLDRRYIDEFEAFVERLETDFHRIAVDPLTWNTTIGALYRQNYAAFVQSKPRAPEELHAFEALSRFYQAFYEGEWSAPIDLLSLKNFATWDDKGSKITSYTLNKFGYAAILDELAKNLPMESVHLSSKVATIDYSGDKTFLKMIDGRIHDTPFDYVISTIPLGHLKAHATHLFKPPLPQRKLDAIRAFGFGSLLKVFLVYDEPFWSENTTSFVPLHVEGCTSESYLSRELHTFETLDWKSNVLVGWLSGRGPRNIDNLSDEELAKHITKHFRETMPDLNVPPPSRIIRTSWLRDDNFRGSYTYITTEAAQLQADPIELLARPVYLHKRPRILFAGEATHSRIFQTTIGAFLSGRREADRLMNYVRLYNADKKPSKNNVALNDELQTMLRVDGIVAEKIGGIY